VTSGEYQRLWKRLSSDELRLIASEGSRSSAGKGTPKDILKWLRRRVAMHKEVMRNIEEEFDLPKLSEDC